MLSVFFIGGEVRRITNLGMQRVSTEEQVLDRQVDMFIGVWCESDIQ